MIWALLAAGFVFLCASAAGALLTLWLLDRRARSRSDH